MTLLSQAVAFAAAAHDGATRKGTDIPYIVHPMEVSAIAATMTDDEEVLCAAMLHDVMEDCGVSYDCLAERFGARVAALVERETQRKTQDPCASWPARKYEAVSRMALGSREEKIIALSDKLSNMRAIRRDFLRDGTATFARFHQKDIRWHAWYYRRCAETLETELRDTHAWQEFSGLVDCVFGEIFEPEEADVRIAI